MRHLLAFVLIIALVGTAAAADLGSVRTTRKDNSHVVISAVTPDGRQGGDIGDPTLIDALPFNDSGSTVNNVDDFDVACPYIDSISPDAWYSFTPAVDMVVIVDLLGSGYDTKTYILDSTGAEIGCNDDSHHPGYVSYLADVQLFGGETYSIVVDGYGGAAGNYVINVTEFETCLDQCIGMPEGEPTLGPGYVDNFNGGCNIEGLTPFLALEADEMGNLVFCGVTGHYDTSRDTDWMTIVIGDSGVVEWTLQATFATSGYQIGPLDCETVDILAGQIMEAMDCSDGMMTISGIPGEIAWIWVGPTSYDGFGEYPYTCIFSGLSGGTVATESMSFDGIKSLYR